MKHNSRHLVSAAPEATSATCTQARSDIAQEHKQLGGTQTIYNNYWSLQSTTNAISKTYNSRHLVPAAPEATSATCTQAESDNAQEHKQLDGT